MTDLFAGDQSGQLDDKKSYLDELLGPGGKFDSTKYASRDAALEALARGKVEADSYIPNLLTKMDEMRTDITQYRAEANARPGLEQLIQQITDRNNEPNINAPEPNANDGNKVTAIDPKQIEDMVAAKISEQETRRVQLANSNRVQAKLQEKFGPNYAAQLNMKAKSLGLDQETVNRLAQTSPDAFFNTFGLNDVQAQPTGTPPRSSVVNSFTPNAPEERTWAWYQKMRKERPEEYYSGKWTLQRIDDAARLGPKFEDGNWNDLGDK